MKYLCLVYEDEYEVATMPAERYDAIVSEVVDYLDVLRQGHNLVDASPLDSSKQAVKVKVRGGKASITDGPFVETKEQLGGFFLIEARDLNDAIRLASRMPPARHGTIEIRPLKQLGIREPIPG